MTRNPIVQSTHWVENDPTVGLLILVDKPFYETLQYVIEPLRIAVPFSVVHCGTSATFRSFAQPGGRVYTMQSRNKKVDGMVAVRVIFSKHEVIKLIEAKTVSIENLFTPYVQAAQTVPGVLAIGIGFNLSFPSDLDETSLRQAGIVLLFTRNVDKKSWSRQRITPLVGHNWLN